VTPFAVGLVPSGNRDKLCRTRTAFLHGAQGPLEIDGLWAIMFGGGPASNSGAANTLFFTAGIDDEAAKFATISAMRLAPLVLLLTFALPAHADKVDEFIESEMREQHVPGLSIAVIENGKPKKVRGYGFANLEHRVKAAPETIYQSGSMGKQFTAMLMLMLAEEGKLSLDDTLGKYFPDAPDFWKPITLRRAMSHTAGLSECDVDFQREYKQEEILAECYKATQIFAPGDTWAYSNLGFMLMGFIAERIEGKTYHQLVQEKIFKPLGMNTARGIEEADIISNRAAGYVWRKDHLENQRWVTPAWNRTADGSLYYSINDLVRWEKALREQTLLKSASYDQMWTQTPANDGRKMPYGLGFYVGSYGTRKIIRHSGHWQGFSTEILRLADGKLTVIVLTNRGGVNTARLGRKIAALYDPTLAVPQPSAVAIDATALQPYVGEYVFHRGTKVKLTVKNGKLIAGVAGSMLSASDETFELAPTSSTTFISAEHDWDVSFRKDASGAVTHLVLGFYGGDLLAPRVGDQ
jgi:CubicO group peptidase (beta-lactamase class C family)